MLRRVCEKWRGFLILVFLVTSGWSWAQLNAPKMWIIVPVSVGCCYLVSKVKVKVKSLSCVRLFATPWTVAYQAPPSMGFPRQEYWSGLPFPSPGLRMYRILYKFKSKKSKKIQSVSGQKNRTLHQRKHINGKYAHENLFNNTSHLFIVQSLSHA